VIPGIHLLVCRQDYTKSYRRIWLKFSEVRPGQATAAINVQEIKPEPEALKVDIEALLKKDIRDKFRQCLEEKRDKVTQLNSAIHAAAQRRSFQWRQQQESRGSRQKL